ncbi:MAG: N-acetyltransferase [Pseudomonadota bacterium]
MSIAPAIRGALAGDGPAIAEILTAAFPEEDLTGTVAALLKRQDVTALVAGAQEGLAGLVLFTRCSVAAGVEPVALLGPLAVAPDAQRGGIGSSLVRLGLGLMRELGVAHVLVLGDPGYYGRFGFAMEQGIDTPCAIPRDWAPAWQGLRLSDAPVSSGRLAVPAPWRNPALWAP